MRVRAVAPILRGLPPLALGLDLDQRQPPPVAGTDDETVELAGPETGLALARFGDGGSQHPEPLAAEGCPGSPEPDDAVQLLRRLRPVEVQLLGLDLGRVRRL